MIRYSNAQNLQAMQQQAQPLMQSNAELARLEAKRNPLYTEVWSRYGPEIEAELASLPIQMKVNPKIWNDAAALIKGRHAEDIFKHRASQKGTDTGTFSSEGGIGTNAPSFSSPLESAWAKDDTWILPFKKLPGMSLRKLQEKVSAMGWTEEKYVESYARRKSMHIHNSDAELAWHGVS